MQLKSILRPLILAAGLLPGITLFSQITIVHVGPGFDQGEYEGVYYVLPQTALEIEVEMDKIIKLEGPFSRYADEYLGLEDIVERDLVTYELRKVRVKTSSVPDPEQVYFLARNEKQGREEKALLLSLDRSGIFLGAELLRPMDEQKSGLVTTDPQVDPDSLERYFRFLAANNIGIKVDTITRKITIDTTTIFRNSYKRRMVEKDDEQKVRDAVDQIELIRSNKFNILTGYQEVAYSKETMKFMIDQLDRMEKEYLDLFRGKIMKRSITYSYVYIPKVEDMQEEWVPIFGLSERTGFQKLKDANEELFYLRFENMGITELAGSDLADPGKTLEGLSYRFPEKVAISMKYKGREYDLMMTEVSQFGKVGVLPFGTNKMNLHNITGSIRSVLIEY